MKFLLGQYVSPMRFLKAEGLEQSNIHHLSNINHLSYPFWQGKNEDAGAQLTCTAHDVKRAKAILHQEFESEQLKSFYRDCQGIFVHSASQAEELREFAGVSSQVICKVPHGSYTFGLEDGNVAFSSQDEPQSSGLFFGMIRDEKNLDGLLHALAKSKQNISLVVAGKPAGAGHRPIEYYEELAKRLGIHHWIDWRVRFIPDNEVSELFNDCHWVALPYLPEFSSQSGVFSIATHFHKPILASPAPTFAELLKTYPIGVLADDLSSLALSHAMDEIAVKSKIAGTFQFDSYLKHHTWERNAEITTNAYMKMMGVR